MQLEVSVLSKAGGRAVNEDAYGVWSAAGAGTCFVVLSDGAGGHGGGDVASKIVVEETLGFFHQHPEASEAAVRAALDTANQTVMREQKSAQSQGDMRATVVVLGLDTQAGHAVWMHVGDSRLYIFRNDRLLMRTRDHSVLQSMIDAGYVPDTNVTANPKRNTLMSALGDAAAFKHASPDRLIIEPDDVFLLCSDGLWDYFEDAEIEAFLTQAPTLEAWLRALEDAVIARARNHFDNYSAVAIRCAHDPEEHAN
jgi:PPM family protein phosphatase